MSETAYRLSLAPVLEAFRPEIEHACGFLDACYLVRRTPDAASVLHYGPDAPPGAIAVPAALFPAGVRVDAGGIHPQRSALEEMTRPGGGLRRSDPPRGPDGLFYDAIGLIFFMLSRVEEREHPKRDRYNRFPIEAALFAPEDGRLEPLADYAARDLAAAITGNPDPGRRTSYKVLFTHDVDILRGYHRWFEPLRNAAGDIVKRASPGAAWSRLRRAYLEGEPWNSMRRLMSLSEKQGINSHFYFLGPSDDPMDSPYVLRLPGLLRKVASEIRARGHVIGFHPGFHTFDDAGEWKRQRDGLEAVVGAPLREGRHHVLRYDAAVTPRIWSDAGMTLDCTPAYPEAVGFRTGTCRPHQAYDLRGRAALPLLQVSTPVMEFGMFGGKYRDLSVEQAVAESVWAADVCRDFGGIFTLLFHSGQNDPKLWAWAEAVVARTAP
jgi:hypothetical protein